MLPVPQQLREHGPDNNAKPSYGRNKPDFQIGTQHSISVDAGERICGACGEKKARLLVIVRRHGDHLLAVGATIGELF